MVRRALNVLGYDLAIVPEFEKYGASLVAISPQTQANSRRLVRQNNYLIDLYQNVFKNNLAVVNGDPIWTLPMPARFVIAQDGTILYAKASPDYTRRPDPEELLPALQELRAAA